MSLYLRSIADVAELGGILLEAGRDLARVGIGWLCNNDDPMVDLGPDDEAPV